MASPKTPVSGQGDKTGERTTPTKSPRIFQILRNRDRTNRCLTPSIETPPTATTNEKRIEHSKVLEQARLFDEMAKGVTSKELERRKNGRGKADIASQSEEANKNAVVSAMGGPEERDAILQRLEFLEAKLGVSTSGANGEDADLAGRLTTLEQLDVENGQEIETQHAPSESDKPTRKKFKRKLMGKCVVM